MKKSNFLASLGLGVLLSVQVIQAQTVVLPQSPQGYINTQTSHLNLDYDQVMSKLNEMIHFPAQAEWEIIEHKKSEDGKLRVTVVPHISGVKMEGNMLILHFREGVLYAVNGNVANINHKQSTIPSVSKETAIANVARMSDLAFKREHSEAQLVFRNIEGENYLSWKVEIRGMGKKELQFKHFVAYVDALNGEVLHIFNKIHHHNTLGSGESFYYGNVDLEFMQDEHNNYILEDTVRKIRVSNVAGQIVEELGMSVEETYPNKRAIMSSVSNFTSEKTIVRATINAAPQNMTSGYGLSGMNYVVPMITLVESEGNESDTMGRAILNVGSTMTMPSATEELYVHLKEDKDYQIGIQKINIDLYNGGFTVIEEYFAELTNTSLGLNTIQPNPELGFSYNISTTPNLGVDALYTLQKTYDFYLNEFGRNGVDDLNTPIDVLVDGVYSLYLTQANAFALTFQKMIVFGIGDGFFMNPLVTLDVMAHEYQHIVTDYNGRWGLEYAKEPGALNEAWSDIFGKAVEFKTHPHLATWEIGSELSVIPGGYMRSMSEPNATGNPMYVSPAQPNTYHGEHWFDIESQEDNGGVHYNSGVANKWFYLLVEGGSGVNDNNKTYSVDPIGWDKALEIAYVSLMEKFTYVTDYPQAADLTWTVAKELYGAHSQEAQSVYDAWYAVGLFEGGPISVNEFMQEDHKIVVYPNPNTGQFSIKQEDNSLLSVEIYNVTGKKVYSTSARESLIEVNLEGIASGVYFIEINNGSNKRVEKLVVQ